jgi:hydrogenase/urease accessory protein HupE
VGDVLFAHGLNTAADTVPGFVWLGFVHMLQGWDHLLFIGGVVLLAARVRIAAGMLSLFALGHSSTLFTATVVGWRFDPLPVDVIIALSVAFVGVVALAGRPRDWTWFGAAVFALGLVHGLGLSTRLQALGLPQDGTIPRVLAFNVGVELGQLLAVVVVYAAGVLVARRVSWAALPRVTASVLVAVGAITAVVVPFTDPGELPFAAGRSDVCTVYDRPLDYPTGAATAPSFTEPGGSVEDGAYGRALAQDFVVVRYRLPAESGTVDRLRSWAYDPATTEMVIGPGEQSEPVIASTPQHSLRCTAFDEDALRHFAGDWLENRGGE